MKNKKYPYYFSPEMTTMQDLLNFCVKTYPDKTAFHYLEKKCEIKKTYKNFYDDVAALCLYLKGKKYNRTHIAIVGENSYKWLVAYFAIINSNNVAVPLDKELDDESLNSLITESDSTVVIYSENYADIQFKEELELINMGNFEEIFDSSKNKIFSPDSFYNDFPLDPDATAVIVYTSGTTATPKGAMLTHRGLSCDAANTQRNSTVPDSSILVLPLFHTYAIILAISVPMLVGASIFINKSMRTLMSDIELSKPKYIAMVPLMLEIFYKKINESLYKSGNFEKVQKLRTLSNAIRKIGIDKRRVFFAKILAAFGGNLELIAVGGAPINSTHVSTLTDYGIQVLAGYGTTECSPIVSSVRNKHYNPASSGTVIPNVHARIVDGELQIKGPIVFSGYYKNEEATKAVFDGEWYKTGDLAKIEDDYLFITGRCKNMIVLSNGKNISPERLELLIQNNCNNIGEVIVYNKGDVLFAETFIPDCSEELKNNIRADLTALNKTLPLYQQISEIIFRDEDFEKTTTKKIKRKY